MKFSTLIVLLVTFVLASCQPDPAVTPVDAPHNAPPIRANLIHITHYDPGWLADDRKENEQRFDLETALAIVDAMKATDMNMLIVDIGDGIVYESHPELTRHYSAPMEDLVVLARAAREAGIEFVPKLNFAKSAYTQHDKWMAPHSIDNFPSNRDEYFTVAKDVIDELAENIPDLRYFHIGMDEDHKRSVEIYVADIIELHGHLAAKDIRTIIWNDAMYIYRRVKAQVHAEKSLAAAPRLPRDIVHILWDYDITTPGIMAGLSDLGLEVWIAPGGREENIRGWAELSALEGGDGMLLTTWIKCSVENRDILLDSVNQSGPLYKSLQQQYGSASQ